MPPSSPSTIDVLVVGAGPTGLTMALELARHGLRPRIIDQAAVPPADTSRALAVQPRTLELFDMVGIGAQAVDAGLITQGINLVSQRGHRTAIPMAAFETLDSPYAKVLMLPQRDTERLLAARAETLGVVIERGVALDSFSDNGRITARLRHADGHIEEISVQWLIGCDGAHSTVRNGAGIPFDGITYADECLLGDIHVDWAFPDAVLTLCPTPEGVLAAFPIRGAHHFRVIMILPRDDTAQGRALSPEEFEAQLRRMVPPSDRTPVIQDIAWATRYRLHRKGVPRYRANHVFLAGDAAHIHSPAGGQGMNTGIQDAFNLAWKLALVARGRAPAALLDTYDAERRPVARTLLRGTDVMFAAMVSRGPGGLLIRHFAPGLVLRLLLVPAIRRRLVRFMSELGIGYPHSPLSVNGGDRAPDATFRRADGTTGQVFDLFRVPGYVALLLGDAPELTATADRINHLYGADVDAHVIADPTVRAKYGVPNGGQILVRPDRYIALRTASTDANVLLADLARRFTP
jgi:2-polyprenyl-6-methoxyphenol hydroxylase-like FAD-dependent oxidoreductase